ncbi:MAG: metallophosphoesterase [Candidatus Micrarchaeota archaeon]|nr:metallophosphoesterase [Candidatus Micrarchaeota archaeon]
MKIAFVSDTHFGYERFEEDAFRQGKEALIDASKVADIIILGGDIFDKREPTLETMAKVIEILKEAKNSLPEKFEKKIFAIAGTHEYSAKNVMNPIEFLEKIGLVESIHNKRVVLEDLEQKIVIRGMKGIPEELVKKAFEKFEEVKEKEKDKEKDIYKIFVFHQTLKEFIGVQDENLASIEDLPEGYDLYLCGHIHCYRQYLGGKLQIPGSTVITQLKDEEQAEKGYLLIDTKTKTIEFRKINTRKFIVLDLWFKEATTKEIKEAIEKELEKIAKENYQKPIVKIKLNGTLSPQAIEAAIEINREDMIVEIDKNLEAISLFEKLNNLKYKKDQNIEELGIKFLFENASKLNISKEKAEELFKKFLKE